MIEKKFNDPTGFSDKNTFFQFDQRETQRIHGAKNRFIYDFSFPIIDGYSDDYLLNLNYPEGTAFTPFRSKILVNLAPETQSGLVTYGAPGGEAEYVGELLSERTINENEASIYVDENTLMHIDKALSGSYGVTQFADGVDFFRSGYVEFTIKTDKKNCIIASGTSQVTAKDFATIFGVLGSSIELGTSISSLNSGDTMSPYSLVSENYPYYRADSFDGALINLNIRLIDGKLAIEYYDDYNRDDVNFIFIGNEDIANNEWHHVVVNFGRPGLIKTNGVKFNKKFVEIWVDGNLDKRFDDKVNEYQIFYPTVKWLFNNVKDIIYNVIDNEYDIESNMDVRGTTINLTSSLSTYGRGGRTGETIGFNDIMNDEDLFVAAVNSNFYKVNGYRGAMHLFAHGINIPISQYEIKRRLRLWKKQTKKFATAINVQASMVSPTVSTNSKKALKLFWNNLISDGKYGLELDENFQVEAYSVTHKIFNSSTEILNHDVTSDKKEVNVLENVRVVLTDNVLVNGPGMVFISNTEEAYAYNLGLGPDFAAVQDNPKGRGFDSVGSSLNSYQRFVGPRDDMAFSGIILNNGDRILLTGQIKTEENGIWIFNGLDKYLTRSSDALPTNEKINAVYVTDGYNAKTYWKLESAGKSLRDPQKWSIVNMSNIQDINVNFDINNRWKDYHGEDRFINILEDIDINRYDIVTFMNYPESNEQIFELFPNELELKVLDMYNEFIDNIKVAASNGASVFVASPKLAEDLGVVKNYSKIDQEIEESDAHSAEINPFQFDESAERYFDTHRQNQYHLATEVPGLTDKETWVMTDFINYIPQNEYDREQWHVKYSYRQFGLKEGNQFFIPGLPLRKLSLNKSIPGYRQNARLDSVYAVAPSDIIAGTVVTKLANNHYHGADLVVNEYDDYATTIIVHNGQLLGEYPINGKIFVNCTEDSYTMSRKEYNYSTIQIVPESDTNETVNTRLWQYSTSRLNRVPNRINIRSLESYGQTTPTRGGGGPLVQASTNSSNGIIRSITDSTNNNTVSDLYPSENEEIYPIQNIPAFSMTWLGLQWLAE